jgi:hypothetical protein
MWRKYLIVRSEKKILEENRDSCLDISLVSDVLDITLKGKAAKSKVNKWYSSN